ncbi:Bacitracin synthase 3 [Orchesella cincta]|uniref:Bacitracin synthase 3 n=1 Tax=Orchesella cincta TaxID=48709 RepID=A0A1D2MHI9_ORCCI|nr:Bacitracin synthase 3 [Orchesella cincta]
MIRATDQSFYPRVDIPTTDSSIHRHISISPAATIDGRTSQTAIKHNTAIREMFSRMLMRIALNVSDTALIYGTDRQHMSFRELEERSSAMAKHLGTLWLKEHGGSGHIHSNSDGDAVVLYCANSSTCQEKTIVLLLTILKLGLTFMAVDPEVSNSELHKILHTIEPCMIVSDSKCSILSTLMTENNSQHQPKPFVLIDKIWNLPDAALDESAHENSFYLLHPSLETWTNVPAEQRTIAIFFSAGTSGNARPVRIALRELYNLIHWKMKVLPPSAADVYSLTYPPWDVNFLSDVLLPILNGKPLVVFDKRDMESTTRLINTIANTKVSRLSLTPPQFTALINTASKAEQLPIPSVKIWTITGNMLVPSVYKNFFRLFSNYNDVVILFMYGSVEVAGQATYELYEDLHDLERKTLDGVPSVGTPICNTKVFIVDEKDKNVPINTIGEIAFSGSCVTSGGYASCGNGGFKKLGASGDQEPKSANRLFRSGDFGKIVVDAGGIKRLYVTGHLCNCISFGNQSIDLKDLSHEIFQTGMVSACHVVACQHGREDSVMVAACVLKNKATPQLILDKLKVGGESKNSHVIPWIFPMASIPLLPNGRVACSTIRQMYRSSMIDCEPKSWNVLDLLPEQETHVKALCRAVALSVAVPLQFVINNFENSFWEIGGSSVDSVSLLNMIVKSGYPIGLQDITDSASLGQLLEKMMVAKSVAKVDTCFYCLKKDMYKVAPMTIADEEHVMRLLIKDVNSKVHIGSNKPDTLTAYWKSVLENVRDNGLCMLAKTPTDQIVGIIINIPADHQVKIKKPPKEILYSLELFQACKKVNKYAEWRQSQQKILQVYYISVDHSALTRGQDGQVVHLLLLESQEVAKDQGFTTFVIEATNSLVQEISINLLKMNTLFEFPIRRFKAQDKIRPFLLETDYKKIGMYYLNLSREIC